MTLPGLISGKLQFAGRARRWRDRDRTQNARGGRKSPATQFDNLVLRRATVTFLRAGAPGFALKIWISPATRLRWRGRSTGRGPLTDEAARLHLRQRCAREKPAAAEGQPDLARATAGSSISTAARFRRRARSRARPRRRASRAGAWPAQACSLAWLDGARAKRFSARLGDGPLADKVSGSMR